MSRRQHCWPRQAAVPPDNPVLLLDAMGAVDPGLEEDVFVAETVFSLAREVRLLSRCSFEICRLRSMG